MPVSGVLDFGMMARAVRSLASVGTDSAPTTSVLRLARRISVAAIGESVWPTYPGGDPSTGATSHVLKAMSDAPEAFAGDADASWLLEAQNPDGGWGEFADSSSRIDNTFWAHRACLTGDDPPPSTVGAWLMSCPLSTDYEHAMAARLRVGLGEVLADDRVMDMALDALSDDADRYAETALYGLALAESLTVESDDEADAASSHCLPVRTPQFIRHEPTIYDQLAETTPAKPWTSFVDRCARLRLFETTIGWLAGISAAIAIVGEELIDGVQALPLAALVVFAVLEAILVGAWLAIRHSSRRPLNGVPHFLLAIGLATLVILVVKAPADMAIPLFPTVILVVMLGLIVDAVAVATDKADLLNRLGDD